jgi:hypothetical protein
MPSHSKTAVVLLATNGQPLQARVRARRRKVRVEFGTEGDAVDRRLTLRSFMAPARATQRKGQMRLKKKPSINPEWYPSWTLG